MEQVLIRNLPGGTKARLKDLARRHDRTMEAEARTILQEGLDRQGGSIVDLLAMPGGESVDFTPGRLGLMGREAQL